MNILIVGCGKVGAKLAWMLANDGYDVSVVDEDEEKLKALGVDFPGYTTLGSPIDLDVLKKAGIESCHAMAALCAEDTVNIMAAQIAREMFGIKKVLTRIYDPKREAVYSDLGLPTFCPTNSTAEAARGMLLEGEKPKSIIIGTHTTHFYEVAAPRHVIGYDVSQVELEKDHYLFGVKRHDGNLEICDGSAKRIKKGDVLVICVLAD